MSEALRLADLLEPCCLTIGDAQQAVAAAELRRLHAENEQLRAQNTELDAACAKLEAELAEQARLNGMGGEREARLMALNAELVEALCCCRDMVAHPDNLAFIDAALAKVGVSK